MTGRAPTQEQAYEAAREAVHGDSLREPAPVFRRVAELELQARIYGGEFGVSWRGEEGESIEMIHFGTWNRESGPDFCGVRAVLNGVAVSGDMEIDGDARDWEAHGHAGNEAFDQVILHVFFRKGPRRFFTRTSQNRSVVQICLGQRRVARPAPAGSAVGRWTKRGRGS